MEWGHRIISNGMVLQQEEDFILTGAAADGELVKITFAEEEKEVFGERGRFCVRFEKIKAGGPFSLTVTRGGYRETVEDILVGDIYFMSGQSNMELDINWVYYSFQKEIDETYCDAIRQFKVPISYDFTQEWSDVSGGEWKKAIGEDKKTFGALGFFMAKKLYERYRVPIGLIQTAVPGCPIESFMTKENAEKFQQVVLDEKCVSQEAMRKQKEKEEHDWEMRVQEMLRADDDFPQGSWKRTVIPFLREESQDSQAGIYEFRKMVELEKKPEKDAVLKLGLLIEADVTYVNGKMVGKTDYQYPPRRYIVPHGLLHAGKNEIIVKVIVTNGICRFWEKLEYSLEVDGTIIDLTGVWQMRKGKFSSEGFFKKTFWEYLPYGVYNAMLAPLMEIPVKAFLWYQGESNTGDPENYCKKFAVLIEQFREAMKRPDLPVYYVQIAYYEDPADVDGNGWKQLRREQEKAQMLPHVNMTVSGDVGSPTDLHPQNKKVIGERIAQQIIKNTEAEQK
ncbi:sialate O-acetylesterase [Parablautia sp. Marseille-Q6255]|uniref:sialate O-acetylesterase n=1 Tax=Parablautia sp. Marseille-Q6255 TaxID=3039593 RepID=UPI0024BC0F40|nr:sialate O-acetylesterase [Parablautia sp. Marseille-Q6255]